MWVSVSQLMWKVPKDLLLSGFGRNMGNEPYTTGQIMHSKSSVYPKSWPASPEMPASSGIFPKALCIVCLTRTQKGPNEWQFGIMHVLFSQQTSAPTPGSGPSANVLKALDGRQQPRTSLRSGMSVRLWVHVHARTCLKHYLCLSKSSLTSYPP
jgi:hypothetical protein